MRKKCARVVSLFLAVALALTGMIFPQETKAAEKVKENVWEGAQWIWDSSLPQNLPESGDVWMNFRKMFELDKVPSSATAKIGAESRYWLYINGELVVFEGNLKRGPNRQDGYYDVVDLTQYLTEGENTIAVAVWYWGKGSQSFSSSPAGAGGFVFEADFGDEGYLISDSTWKVKQDTAYKHSSELENSSEQPNYRLAEKNIYYDARDELGEWQKPGYDDSDWTQAVVRGSVGDAPWNNLYERPIPLLKDYGLKDYNNSKDYEGVTLEEDTVLDMVLDYNAQLTPYLEIEAPAGMKIDMRTDNYSDPAGNGNSVKSAYVTKEGLQSFEALGWFNGEHVYYTIPAGVTIKALKYRETGYNTEFAGSFSSDDEFLNSLWEKSARTLYITMRDNFMDCPDRERAQWWGDVTSEMMMSMYALDQEAYKLYEKGLETKRGFIQNDVLYTVAPQTGYDTELPMQELAGICGVWEYYLYTGRLDIVEDMFVPMQKYMQKWKIKNDGLVGHYGGTWDWMDWGSNADVTAIENAWYYMAADRMMKMADALGKDDDVTYYEEIKAQIERGYKSLWTTNGYKSSTQSAPDDRANALAVLAGLATPDQYETILKVLTTTYNSSPYMEKYVLDAMVDMGYMEQAQKRIKYRYADMVEGDQAYSTLWEFWDKNAGTKNHAWTGGPLITMSKDMAGVAPLTPGYETYQIKPDLGTVSQIAVCVPAVIGNINVTMRRDDDAKTFDISVNAPDGGNSQIAIPRFAGENVSVSVNGTVVFKDGGAAENMEGLEYISNDSRYIYFSAEPGEWNFSESVGQAGEEDQYTVTIDGTEGGAVYINGEEQTLPYSQTFPAGTKLELNAVPDDAHEFGGWNGTLGMSDKDVQITVNHNVNLTASFNEKHVSAYSVVKIEDPNDTGINFECNGVVYTTPASITVKTGEKASLKILDEQTGNYDFINWSGEVYSAERELELDVTGDMALSINGIYTSGTNLALGAEIQAENGIGGTWAESNLTDGNPDTGFSTNTYGAQDLAATESGSQTITLNLKEEKTFDTVVLYPRRDALDAEGGSPNFPTEFYIQISSDGVNYEDVQHITVEQNPRGAAQKYILDSAVSAQYVRIKTVKLGTPAADEGIANPYRVQIMEIEMFNQSGQGDCSLTVNGSGEGNGSLLINGKEEKLPLQTSYEAGTKLAIEAVPGENSQFTGWSGDLSNNSRVIYVELHKDINLEADFASFNTEDNVPINLAEGKTVQTEYDDGGLPMWGGSNLTDGKTESEGRNDPTAGVKGYTSRVYSFTDYPDRDISENPHHITIDLGEDMTFSEIVMYARNDTDAKMEGSDGSGSGLCANFPENFNINIKAEGEEEFRTVATVTEQKDIALDDNKRSYSLEEPVTARYVQIETTKLGTPSYDEGNEQSGGARVQLAEIQVIGTEDVFTEGLIELSAKQTEGLKSGNSYEITAAVTDSSLSDNSLVWSVEDEQGFPSTVASLQIEENKTPVLRADNMGTAYVTARFVNGTGTAVRMKVTVTEEGATEFIPADKSELEAMIQQAETLEWENYTEESIKVLNDALVQAKKIMADDTLGQDAQEQVDSAVAAVKEAMDSLVEKTQSGEDPGSQPDQGDEQNPDQNPDQKPGQNTGENDAQISSPDTNSDTMDNEKAVQTGDTLNITVVVGLIMLMTLSAATGAVILWKKRSK